MVHPIFAGQELATEDLSAGTEQVSVIRGQDLLPVRVKELLPLVPVYRRVRAMNHVPVVAQEESAFDARQLWSAALTVFSWLTGGICLDRTAWPFWISNWFARMPSNLTG